MEITVWDDDGLTLDRFTVCVQEGIERDWYSMSEDALSPQGFNLYCGTDTIVDQKFRSIGRKLPNLHDLPLDVRKAIAVRALANGLESWRIQSVVYSAEVR